MKIKADKNNLLKKQMSISKSRTCPFIIYMNNPDCHGKQEDLHRHLLMTRLFLIFHKYPQEAREPVGQLLSERTIRLQLCHKLKSSFRAFFSFNIQMDNLSWCFSHLRVHQNHLEVMSKRRLLDPPPKFLIQQVCVECKNPHF